MPLWQTGKHPRSERGWVNGVHILLWQLQLRLALFLKSRQFNVLPTLINSQLGFLTLLCSICSIGFIVSNKLHKGSGELNNLSLLLLQLKHAPSSQCWWGCNLHSLVSSTLPLIFAEPSAVQSRFSYLGSSVSLSFFRKGWYFTPHNLSLPHAPACTHHCFMLQRLNLSHTTQGGPHSRSLSQFL